MSAKRRAAFVLYASIWVLNGCSGNGAGLDASGQPLGSSGGAGAPLTADFASIQENVFTPVCSVCHAGAGAPEGLELDAGHSYALLVGVPSTEVPSVLRVKPGDPDNSYLIQKLRGTASVGARMPFGEAALPDATLAVISQWISDGAQPPQTAAIGAERERFRVESVFPSDGDVLDAAPERIIVAFNGMLDVTRLNAGTLRLLRAQSADDAQFGDPEVPADVAASPENPRILIMTPRDPLWNGSYRLLIDANRDLADVSGHPLERDVGAVPAPSLEVTFVVDLDR